MLQCAPFVPSAAMRWRCSVYKGTRGVAEAAVFCCMAHDRYSRIRSRREGAPSIGGHVDGRSCVTGRFDTGLDAGIGRGGAGFAGAPAGHLDVGAERRGFARAARLRACHRLGAGWLPIATYRRRRSTPVPGGASSRAPTDARGAVRPSGRTPIYSGHAASASNRPSIYSRAGVAAAGGGRAGRPAARSRGGPHTAARRARGSGRMAGTRAVQAGPTRHAASRRC